jgi:hypothetical protein
VAPAKRSISEAHGRGLGEPVQILEHLGLVAQRSRHRRGLLAAASLQQLAIGRDRLLRAARREQGVGRVEPGARFGAVRPCVLHRAEILA